MRAPTMREAMVIIVDSLTRKKGTFALALLTEQERTLAANSAPFSLCTSAVKAVRTHEGVIVTLALDAEQVEKLRGMCDLALKEYLG